MRILPPSTALWHSPVERRHNPPVASGHLNDPRKVELRRFRRETVKEALDLLKRGRPFLADLLKKAGQAHDSKLIDEAKIIEDALRGAWRNLEAFMVIPQDAQDTCACSTEELCVIPRLLEVQTLEIEPPTAAGNSRGD